MHPCFSGGPRKSGSPRGCFKSAKRGTPGASGPGWNQVKSHLLWMVAKSYTTLKAWLNPLFAGIYRGIASFQVSQVANWISSIHSILVNYSNLTRPNSPQMVVYVGSSLTLFQVGEIFFDSPLNPKPAQTGCGFFPTAARIPSCPCAPWRSHGPQTRNPSRSLGRWACLELRSRDAGFASKTRVGVKKLDLMVT